jgi:dihydroorotase
VRLTLPKWYDLHAHFRQDGLLAPLIADHLKMGCAGILAMPNTKPPVAKVFKSDDLPYWSVEEYLDMLRRAGGDKFEDILVPLYLTADTTPAMIEAGAKSGLLRACKYYPPHGTTGADHGSPFAGFIKNGVFKAMQDHGVVLCIHGEEHGLAPGAYFDRKQNAEEIFYQQRMPELLAHAPTLKIVCEHVTTKVAVDFVKASPAHVAATITPQHLLYTVGDLLKGLKYHLYCLPLLKFEADRDALRGAVTDAGNAKFFAGTDSAPHAKKMTDCGCAAGCYTGGIAPQLYAQAFEEAGADFSSPVTVKAFERFLCLIGPEFYGLKPAQDQFVLEKAPQEIKVLQTPEGPVTPLPLGLEGQTVARIGWRIK